MAVHYLFGQTRRAAGKSGGGGPIRRGSAWAFLLTGGFVIAALIALVLPGCYEPREGCLDVGATNYDVNADRPCDGCCTYPVLRLNFQHKVVYPDTVLNLTLNTAEYYDQGGNAFRVRGIQYYVSNLRFVRPGGEEAGVEDTLTLQVPQTSGDTLPEVVEDNFTLADPGNFRERTVGRIRRNGTFDRLRFTLGLEEAAALADPRPLAAAHPLANSAMYQPDSGRRLFNRIELYRITPAGDTLDTVLRVALPTHRRTVELPVAFFLDPGFNPKVILRVDYLTWFRHINLATDSEEEMIEKIVNNLTNAFSLVEVVAERR